MLGRPMSGDLVHLSVLTPDNLQSLGTWWSQPDLADALIAPRPLLTPTALLAWYEAVAVDESTVIWGISANADLIGMTRLFDIDWLNRHASSETIIAVSDYRGRGYAGEAIGLRSKYAFQNLGLMHLEAMALSSNAAIAAALAKSHYRKVGTRQKYVFRGGAFHDVDLYELTRPEWDAGTKAAAGGAKGTSPAPPAQQPAAATDQKPPPPAGSQQPAAAAGVAPGHPPFKWHPPPHPQPAPPSPADTQPSAGAAEAPAQQAAPPPESESSAPPTSESPA